MVPDRGTVWRRRLMARAGSVRLRTTALATLVVAVALVAAGFGTVALQRQALTDNVDATVRLRADDVTALLRAGASPSVITVSDDEIALIQVVNGEGRVIAASPNAAGLAPVVTLRPAAGQTTVSRVHELPIDDEAFLVLARGVETPAGGMTLLVAGSLEDVVESTGALTGILQVGIPLILVVVAASTWVVVGRALAPMEAIRREVASIGHDELDHRVPETQTQDEVGRLARTMNAMLARLEAASDRQERFVADAAHELRSPLATMRTELEVELAHPGASSPEDTLGGLHADVLRMQRLVEDLLLLARSDGGALVTRHQPVDFDEVVRAEAREARARAGPEVLALVEVDTSGVSAAAVVGDAAQLGRLVRNLLDNAVRHARSRVSVELAESGGSVTLAVTDDGPGIALADQERVFERFTRLDTARARSEGGAGLGLAIARTIVTAHRGTIALDSGYRRGARFVVTLPAEGGAAHGA